MTKQCFTPGKQARSSDTFTCSEVGKAHLVIMVMTSDDRTQSLLNPAIQMSVCFTLVFTTVSHAYLIFLDLEQFVYLE